MTRPDSTRPARAVHVERGGWGKDESSSGHEAAVLREVTEHITLEVI